MPHSHLRALCTLVASAVLLETTPGAPLATVEDTLDVYVNPIAYEQQVAPLAIGDDAPRLLADRWINGAAVNAFAADTVYVLEFWATWCQPCRKSLPEMDAVARRYAERGLRVIGVAGAEEAGPEGIVEFLAKTRLSFPIAYRHTGDMYAAWVRGARGSGLPWVFVIDRHGRLAWWGQPFYKEFERLLESVLDDRHSIGRERQIRASRAANDREGWKLRVDADRALDARQWDRASIILGRLIELNPERYWWEVVERIDVVGTKIGKPVQARLLASQAIHTTSWNNPHALAEIARLLLTAPKPEGRDPRAAVTAARRANELTLGADADVRKVLMLAEGMTAPKTR